MIAREYTISKSKLAAVVTQASPRYDDGIAGLQENARASAIVTAHGDMPVARFPEDAYGCRYVAHEEFPVHMKRVLAIASQDTTTPDPVAFVAPFVRFHDDLSHYHEYLAGLRLARAYGSYILDDSEKPIVVIISGDLLARANKECPFDLRFSDGLEWLHSFGLRFIRSPRYFNADNLALIKRYHTKSVLEEAVSRQPEQAKPKRPRGRPKTK